MSEGTKGYRLWYVYNDKLVLSRDELFDTISVTNMVKRAFGQTEEALTTESAPRGSPTAEETNTPTGGSTGVVGADPLTQSSTDSVGAESPTQAATPEVGATSKRRRAGLVEVPQSQEPRSRREAKKPKRYQDYQIYWCTKCLHPQSLKQALSGPPREQWKQAMELEYDSLIENGTWGHVRLPLGRKAFQCHWVLVVKYNADGTVEQFKARLVAQVNHQGFRVDCDEEYAPVARLELLPSDSNRNRIGLSYPSDGCPYDEERLTRRAMYACLPQKTANSGNDKAGEVS
ncbi:Integrase catalytic core protein [Phytophthora palmivora]|uniref:Integrase catalytic core protein n=1 Tax=Phytophthora palmivora TaxID=4796 RepID=A0A2P4WXB7_9STRA|nr:Integrase catalytic core protein [Phytophthora palmivora]